MVAARVARPSVGVVPAWPEPAVPGPEPRVPGPACGLAERLKVGRATVREAMAGLRQAGLVTTRGGRGVACGEGRG